MGHHKSRFCELLVKMGELWYSGIALAVKANLAKFRGFCRLFGECIGAASHGASLGHLYVSHALGSLYTFLRRQPRKGLIV